MSFFKTRITELLGIKYPILQGGMGAGYVSDIITEAQAVLKKLGQRKHWKAA